jgi:hypothetical protein
MRTPRFITIAVLVLGMGVLIVTFALQYGSPPVSLAVLAFTTNQWTADNDKLAGNCNHVCAIVELTNCSSRSVSYWGWDLGSGRGGLRLGPHPHYTLLYQTSAGWKDLVTYGSFGIGFRQFALAPAQTITFEALIERAQPCKIALNYSDGRTSSSWWQRHLPEWVVQRLPWAKSSRTVTTTEIDLSSTVL